ncbi:MAG: hypothetical protein JW941_00910 [Candidatus Coatesbacteria bacterium]|nr:hypothetical protein [Candidatus Coatesbacteria bacterium]
MLDDKYPVECFDRRLIDAAAIPMTENTIITVPDSMLIPGSLSETHLN